MFDIENFQRELFKLRDEGYKNFQAKIVPTVDKEKFIGIRTADLCGFAKNYFRAEYKDIFQKNLPHKYFEENSVHALLISEMKNFEECLSATKNFLPYVNNWATCDSISPKIFSQHTEELYPKILNWLEAEHVYTIRFGLSMLMKFYLGKNFDVKYLECAAAIRSKEYYVEMMAAWFFATALAKHYDSTIKFLTGKKLSASIHNRTIRKALESRRITAEQKNYLRGLKL